MIIAELKLIALAYDQSLLSLKQNLLSLQAIDPAPNSLERQAQEPRDGRPGDSLLYYVRFDRRNAAILLIQVGALHDLNDICVENGMNNKKIKRVEIIVPEQFAD